MAGKILSKVTWLGKAVVFIVGLTVIFALTAGMASQSMGATGKAFFELGKRNVANATSTLVKQGPGLSILVRPGEPPLRVNSKAKVANLNADMVDGLTAEGLRGQQGDKGDQGDPGQSVTSETLASGDVNCPNGGSKFTSASGETFACTGADGEDGVDGDDGEEDRAPGAQGPTVPGVAAWARVAADGSIQGSSPGVTVRKEVGFPGIYNINIEGSPPVVRSSPHPMRSERKSEPVTPAATHRKFSS